MSDSNKNKDAIDFIITDTGIGMSPDQVEKVFKPFIPEGGAYGIGRTHSHKH